MRIDTRGFIDFAKSEEKNIKKGQKIRNATVKLIAADNVRLNTVERVGLSIRTVAVRTPPGRRERKRVFYSPGRTFCIFFPPFFPQYCR